MSTIHDAFNAYAEIGALNRSHNWKSWMKMWCRDYGDTPLSDVSKAFLVSFVAKQRRSGKAEATIHSQLAYLRVACKHVGHDIPPNPKTHVRNDRVRVWSAKERQSIKEHLHPDDWDIVELAATTALRSMELFSLKRGDVDLNAGFIHVKNGKGGKNRRVPIGRTARRILKRFLSMRSEYAVVPRGYENWKTRRGICNHWKQNVWRPALRAASVTDFTFHDLRHCAASELVSNNVSLYVVQNVLGHSTPAMTMRYSHLSDKALKEAVSFL